MQKKYFKLINTKNYLCRFIHTGLTLKQTTKKKVTETNGCELFIGFVCVSSLGSYPPTPVSWFYLLLVRLLFNSMRRRFVIY